MVQAAREDGIQALAASSNLGNHASHRHNLIKMGIGMLQLCFKRAPCCEHQPRLERMRPFLPLRQVRVMTARPQSGPIQNLARELTGLPRSLKFERSMALQALQGLAECGALGSGLQCSNTFRSLSKTSRLLLSTEVGFLQPKKWTPDASPLQQRSGQLLSNPATFTKT